MVDKTLVRDLMTSPVVHTSLDDTLADTRALFETHRFHHIIVTGDDGRLAGVLSDRDLLGNISPFIGKLAERPTDLASLKRRVHQVMTRNLVTCREHTLARDAAVLMLRGRIGCMPVVDHDRRCVGILTVRDLAGWAIDRMGPPLGTLDQSMINEGIKGVPLGALPGWRHAEAA